MSRLSNGLTAKERAELHRLNKKIFARRPVRRKEIDRAFELQRKAVADRNAAEARP